MPNVQWILMRSILCFGLPGPDLVKICSDLAQSGKLVMLPAPSPILVLPQVVESLKKETLAQVSRFP